MQFSDNPYIVPEMIIISTTKPHVFNKFFWGFEKNNGISNYQKTYGENVYKLKIILSTPSSLIHSSTYNISDTDIMVATGASTEHTANNIDTVTYEVAICSNRDPFCGEITAGLYCPEAKGDPKKININNNNKCRI